MIDGYKYEDLNGNGDIDSGEEYEDGWGIDGHASIDFGLGFTYDFDLDHLVTDAIFPWPD